MGLKLYVDRLSQPSRAVLIFCKANGIDFEEIKVEIFKRQHLSPEFEGTVMIAVIPTTLEIKSLGEAINPLQKLPAIVDGNFKLFESHSILIYIASAFPGVANHWYPADLTKRAKIHSVLDWHHLNLRHGAVIYLRNILAPILGLPLNQEAAAEGEKILISSLSIIENIWLQGNGLYLLGSFQPSIADLSLVCEIMQLEILDEKDRDRILSPHKKVLQWIENTRNATKPHFDEVHNLLYKLKKNLSAQYQANGMMELKIKTPLTSKL
ncbi:hypothetical protein TanjilG_26683 [Lupinus angustifolius]|uniref:glutathione transferase n=1 Tax=Lupinus angustifolius TaxID=3871 RepID=A0A394DMA4_LUPAN|nr:hypothetical protein TanjilG_26683 [Lupinus angustifolius]